MTKQSHKIKRQIFEMEAPRLEVAKWAESNINRVYLPRVASVVEQVCSDMSSPECIYRIDRVAIDLGVLTEQNFEKELIAKIHAELRRALGDAIRAQEREHAERGLDARIASRLELFACFTRTGSLPWWADTTRAGILEENAIELMRAAPRELAVLVRAIAREPEALQRISLAYADGVLAELCELLDEGGRGAAFAAVPPAIAELHRQGKLSVGIPATRYRSIAWQSALRAAASAQSSGALDALCKAALTEIAEAMALTYSELCAIFEEGRHFPDVNSLMREPPFRAIFGRAGADDKEDASAEPEARRRPKERDFEPSFSEADELYTHDAGLVILWPFLRGMLRNLGLVEGDHFKDTAAQRWTVPILSYLSSGDPDAVERRLPLEKILCGLDVTSAIEAHKPLTAAEMGECAKLLEAVIAQMPALNGMSIFDFRSTFLQRNGQLTRRNGAWHLQVKREAHDEVLEQFPWSLSWAVLPWMVAPMRVEWR